MDRERWRRIEQVYHSALERRPDERSTYLDHACEGDEDLRAEINTLLFQSSATEDLVGSRIWEAVGDFAEESSCLTTGAKTRTVRDCRPSGRRRYGKSLSRA